MECPLLQWDELGVFDENFRHAFLSITSMYSRTCILLCLSICRNPVLVVAVVVVVIVDDDNDGDGWWGWWG